MRRSGCLVLSSDALLKVSLADALPLVRKGTKAGGPLMRAPTGVCGWLAVFGAQRTVQNSKWSQKKNQQDSNGTKRGPKGCQPTQKLFRPKF